MPGADSQSIGSHPVPKGLRIEKEGFFMDKAKVNKDWNQRGFSCDIWTDPPGQVWADFVHNTDELVMVIEGEIELSFNGKTYHPKIGDEILIPAGANHTVKNIGKTTSRWFYGYRPVKNS